MKLNIRLMKPESSISDVFKENSKLIQKDWIDNRIKLYVEEKSSGVKGWKNFINEGAKENVFKKNGIIASALLFVPISDKQYMILTFGQGFTKIKESLLEKDFGLKVVLNSVDHKKIKSVDTVKHDEVTIHKKVQTSQQSEVVAFGIDIESDMLREITGVPIDPNFATNVTGKHSLTIQTKLEVNNILNKCKEIYEVYQKDKYKVHFSWVDNIRYIEDIEIIKILNKYLMNDFNNLMTNNNSIDLHLASPEVIDYSRVAFIRYRGFRSKELFSLLNINDYISLINKKGIEINDIDVFKKKHKIEFLDDDEIIIYQWSVYECMVYETKYQNEHYILSDGRWYKIAKNLSDEVNEFFNKLDKSLALPKAYIDENEPMYIERLKELKRDTYICFDRKLIKLPEWSSGIEPCDFFSPQKEFIHIKNDASSSKLSHLFNQGVVSGESFLREQRFRKEFKNKAKQINSKTAKIIPDVRKRPELNEYTIVFAVMRKPYKNGELGLPFFSKLSLKLASQRLIDLGYKVNFSWIQKIRTRDEE